MSGVKVVYGAAWPSWSSDETGPKILDILREEGVKEIDTARGYTNSEEKIGQRNASSEFAIGTKFSGVWAGVPATREEIWNSATTSLEMLKTDQVDIYYLHAPDRVTPLKETLAAIDELFRQGKFKRFGLSNFLPNEVEDVIRVAKENGYVPPTVYQGNYSPVARKPEEILFPLLRQHGIAFYAYSPLAGGFLAKTRTQVEEAAGRFDANTSLGGIYATLYSKPAFLEGLDKWNAISAETGIPKAELAYRWVVYNSPLKHANGDAVIFSGSSVEQTLQTILGIKKGPLSESVAKRIDEVWETVKTEAGLDNFNLNTA
ncbi:aldehyde reductase [Thozetella sp. PMI_491]|nr:aldehyde reductase [Thozetella sp. PMI_491]